MLYMWEECLGLMVGLCLGMWQSSLGIMVGLEWKSLFGRCMWCQGGGKAVGLELCMQFFLVVAGFFKIFILQKFLRKANWSCIF